MEDIRYRPIGVIHSPFKDTTGMPIQPAGAEGVQGSVEVEPDYVAEIKALNGFSHIILLYHFHRSRGFKLEVTPFMDTEKRGVFATRAPKRPNPIGLSIVRLLGQSGRILEVEGIDVLDGTPLLDIKPYVSDFDHPKDIRIGWLERAKKKVQQKTSGNRFK